MWKPLDRFRTRWSGPGSLGVLVLGLSIGMLAFAAGGSFMVYANSEEFCANACHEMAANPAKEYAGSTHDTNRTGVRATCPDCHVPHDYIPNYLAKLGLLSDIWGHFVTGSIDTREKFEAKRHELATRVWMYMKENDSRECRRCHTTAKMDVESQPERAVARHEQARKEGLTCIECHFAIVHDEPEGPGPQEQLAAAAGRNKP